MAAPTLTTLAALKVYLGIASDVTTEDDRLNALLSATEQSIEKWLGRKMLSTARTEYFSGSGRSLLILGQRPVTAVSTVRVDQNGYGGHGSDAFAADTEWELGVDFFPRSLAADESNPGMLEAIGGVWPEGQQNIKVTYTAGYSTIPDDFQNALHVICGEAYAMIAKGGKVTSETLGQYSYSLLVGSALAGDDSQLATARLKLAAYRQVIW